ncbi:MAG: hypothetical protein NC048_04190 [Bacteroides sp.]|nr:hypothetical protein [Ruminococcus flavefaciens]MCM1554675.1 hypothetical protein [Bacteroides sp.]
MKKIEKQVIMVALMIFLSLPAIAGPFGIDMGMSLSEVKQVCRTVPVWIKDDVYEIVPPNTNNQFETYYVRIDSDYGVYWLKAIGQNVYTNKYGEELKSVFDRLVESIKRTYGDRDLYQFNSVKENSFWKKDKDFMYSLMNGDRTLEALWTKEGFLANLRNATEDIEIMTSLLLDSLYRGILVGNNLDVYELSENQKDSIKHNNPELGLVINAFEEKKKSIKSLPEDISSIGVFTHAMSTEKGYVSLEYSFSNSENVKEKEDSVF